MRQDSAGQRVLIVDDCECNRKLLGAILRHRRIMFDEASNGQDALGKLESGAYELVFMDIEMPIMDGFAATVEYRKKNPENRVSIIAITASTGDIGSEAFRQAGFSQKLSKPFALAEIDGILQEHFVGAA